MAKVPTNKDRQYALEIVRDLVESGFLEAITFETYEKDGQIFWTKSKKDDWFHTTHYDIDECLEWRCGCSRFAILTEMVEDWVIKVDIKHIDLRDERARMTGREYCSVEERNYILARNEKLDQFFAATYPLCTVNGFKFYLQEALEVDECRYSDKMFESAKESLRDWAEEEELSEDDWNSYACDYMDDQMDDEDRVDSILGWDDETARLIDFLQNHSINDLHSCNWGRTWGECGRDVIMDFAGY